MAALVEARLQIGPVAQGSQGKRSQAAICGGAGRGSTYVASRNLPYGQHGLVELQTNGPLGSMSTLTVAGVSTPYLRHHFLKAWSPHEPDVVHIDQTKEREGPDSSGGAVTHRPRGLEPAKMITMLDIVHRFMQGDQGGTEVTQTSLADPAKEANPQGSQLQNPSLRHAIGP